MAARYLLYTAGYLAAMDGLVLLGAGDMRWPEARVFAAEYAVLAGAVDAWLARHDTALLHERFSSPIHRDQAWWDRAFLIGTSVVFVAWLVLMGADARRYAWSHVPVILQVFGAAAFAASIYVTWLVFRVNTFAVPQARAQVGRGQRVITDGPYRYVRHPMYSGALFFFLGLPLLLGSWLGLAIGFLVVVALSFRALGEERILRRQLAGYEDYMARVTSRLVPGVW